ncbi:MAG TPA: flagellar hook-associated protein FlgL [Clostridiales bacterium]|nr:flagellar hook-associated protein FlgL [Clostridiales bacterium]
MRITNRMMTNNMLSNINKNKLNMTNLEQQYTSGKKIQRPSDDPIVTVRALKLRTNVSELKQYYEKNIPDAMSWMDVTESALKTINEILREMNTYCNQGSSDTLTASDRSSIVQNLKQMKEQIYQEGNTNYAGRYVFTGFKTDSSLVFQEDTKNLTYSIKENFTGKDLGVIEKVKGDYSLEDLDDPDLDLSVLPKKENSYRLQLSYDNLDVEDMESIQYFKRTADGELLEQPPFTNINRVSVSDENAYWPMDNEINFIPETGELIFGKDAYEEFRTAEKITIDYNKSNFLKGDLKPEHYFDCVVTDTLKPELEPIEYKKEGKQEIQYEINYNQKLTINTEGSEAISHKIGREIDDIINSVEMVENTEKMIAKVKERLQDTNLSQEDREGYERMLEQLDIQLTYGKDIMQKAFSRGISLTHQEQDRVNVAVADLGSRYVRLELTENRLSSQMVDFKELMSKNEDADVVETFIKFTAAQSIYNASLSAASRVVQSTLLDFL